MSADFEHIQRFGSGPARTKNTAGDVPGMISHPTVQPATAEDGALLTAATSDIMTGGHENVRLALAALQPFRRLV